MRVVRRAGLRGLGAAGVDEFGALGQVGRRQQFFHRHLHGGGFGHEAVGVGKGELHGLDLQVLGGHAIHRQGRHVEVLQQPQGHQRRNALAAGRYFVQGVAPVGLANGLHPLGGVGGQVGLGECTALLRGKAGQGLGNFAPVKRFTLGSCNRFQGKRCSLKRPQLPHQRRPALGQKRLGKAGLTAQLVDHRRPLALHHGGHGVAALGHFNGGLHQVAKGQLAKALAQGHPAADRAGHGHAVDAAFGRGGGGVAVFAREVARRPGLWGAARGVEPVQLAPGPHQCKGIAAQAVAHGLHHRHDGRSGHGGIDRVAPAAQHVQARLRRQRVRGGHHVARKHGQAHAAVGVGGLNGGGKVHGRLLNRDTDCGGRHGLDCGTKEKRHLKRCRWGAACGTGPRHAGLCRGVTLRRTPLRVCS